MLRLILLITFLILPYSPATAEDTPAPKTFNAESFTLHNGMQVVVIPNHRAPVVTHMVWYKVGAADELPGLSGMAHYFEHLMFKGTKTMAPGNFSKTIKKWGGKDNAFTGQDYTAYFESIAVDHLPKIMAMEADRMQNLDVPPDHFQSEKDVVLEERRQRTENDPRGLFAEQMDSALFVNHPYGIPVIGWMDEIKNYTWAQVKTFYDQWYAPNNAVLVVSGDITAKDLRPLAEKTYGQIPAKDIPTRTRPAVPPAIGDTHMTLHHSQINQPMLVKTYIAPAFAKAREDSYALQVLGNILDGGAATRLYKSLVVEQKVATSINFSYNETALDYGRISIYAVPSADHTLEDVEQKIDLEIKKIITEGVSAQEVQESIQRLQDEAIYARDSLAGPAMVFGQMLATGATINDVENWPANIAQVTPEQIQQVATTYLNPDHPWIRPPITGYLLPETNHE